MFKHKPRALAILGFAIVPALLAQSPSDDGLPPGAMQSKAHTACMECHESRIILQQRLNKVAWTKEVDKMTKWGAVVDSKDRDALIDYLSANFPPEKPAYVASRVSANRKHK
jgi:hypothetical protein